MVLMAHEVRLEKGESDNIPDSFFHLLLWMGLHKNEKRWMDIGNILKSQRK